MDAETFDRLVRALTGGRTRRGLLSLLAAMPLATTIATLLPGAADAAGRRKTRNRDDPEPHQDDHSGPLQNGTHSEACIPTGKRCPAKKPRGKQGKNLGCSECCQRFVLTTAHGRRICGCTPAGESCNGSRQCCSGVCSGGACQSGGSGPPPPPCVPRTCPANVCGDLPDGCGGTLYCGGCAACERCSGGACVADASQNRTVCAGSGVTRSICCNGTCCDGCCGSDGSCGACLVFVSSTKNNGDLDGLDGADAFCQDLADSENLPGSYMAWLSTGTAVGVTPLTRFRHSGQPYRLRDAVSTQVADNWNDLTTCDGAPDFACLDHAINVTETGAMVNAPPIVWTNTATNGNEVAPPNNFDCDNWTRGDDVDEVAGAFGQTNSVRLIWTHSGAIGCSFEAHLYCFQQE